MQDPARNDVAASEDAASCASAGAASPELHASEALAMMVEALRLIDLSGGAAVAGAHLDLAIHRLREWIEEGA